MLDMNTFVIICNGRETTPRGNLYILYKINPLDKRNKIKYPTSNCYELFFPFSSMAFFNRSISRACFFIISCISDKDMSGALSDGSD